MAADDRSLFDEVRDRRWDAVRTLLARSGGDPVSRSLARAALVVVRRRWSSAADHLATARAQGPSTDPREAAGMARAVAELLGETPDGLQLAVAARSIELRERVRASLPAAATRRALGELVAAGARPTVGGLRLIERIGSGATGDVWRGVNDAGLAVAVKVLGAGASRRARRSMLDELRGLTALDHPNVVWLLGHGALDEAAEAMGVGPVDTPYLVLEFVEGRPMSAVTRTPWVRVRAWLLGILSGLAHAHALGLAHLDLKPENVIVDRLGTPRIVDFGLARWRGDQRRHGVAGTPSFMAPEQIRADEDDLGPWTDLYAVGAIAWALVTGEPPFEDDDVDVVFEQHLRSDLPPLPPDARAPEGFEGWVRRMMAKRREHRPRSAAEAAAALDALGARAAGSRSHPSAESLAETAIFVLRRPEVDDDPEGPLPEPAGPLAPLPDFPVPPRPSPSTGTERPAVQLEAGVSLLALRRPPLVGRIEERQRLWDALVGAAGSRRPRILRMRGPGGVGSSRLAGWLAEHAAELGVARGTRLAAPEERLAQLGEELGVSRLTAGRTERRLERRVSDPEERELLVAGWSGRTELAPAAVRGLMLRHWRRLASECRALVVVADGVRPEPEILDTLADADLPLVLVWVNPDDGGAVDLELAPMPEGDLADLVRRWIPLEATACADLVAASAGRPAVAHRLLVGLASTDGLIGTAAGWRIAPGRDLASAVDAPWIERIDAAGLGELVRLCAVLGEATETELRAAARAAEVELRPGWIERAQALGLLDRAGDRLTPIPAVAAAAVSAIGPQTARRLHEACLALGGSPARRARHLRGAGRPAEALPEIRAAWRQARERAAWSEVRRLLGTWEGALTEAGVPPGDPAWLQLLVERGNEARYRNDLEAATAAVERIDEGAAAHGWPVDTVKVLVLRADIAARRMQRGQARQLYERALVVARAGGDDAATSQACSRLSFAALLEGRLDDAEALVDEALRLHPGQVDLYCLRAALRSRAEDRPGALRALREAHAAAAGRPSELSQVVAARAERAAMDFDWSRAADLFLEAARRMELLGLFRGVLVGNAATCLFRAGRDEQAIAVAARLRGRTMPSERIAWVSLELMRAVADDGDEWRTALEELADSPFLLHVRDNVIEVARRRAMEAGRTERALEVATRLGAAG
ncbi:MAG: protein kinase [Alphaproteobacteria bacterium]|nr:protein kinase [Alphaproteobacteria bacterium]